MANMQKPFFHLLQMLIRQNEMYRFCKTKCDFFVQNEMCKNRGAHTTIIKPTCTSYWVGFVYTPSSNLIFSLGFFRAMPFLAQ